MIFFRDPWGYRLEILMPGDLYTDSYLLRNRLNRKQILTLLGLRALLSILQSSIFLCPNSLTFCIRCLLQKMDLSDHYDIQNKLDEGAFGIVTLAISKKDNTKVAIKEIMAKVHSWDECMNMREVKSLRLMSNPNVVKLKEARKVKDTLFLIFEYVDTNLYKFYLGFKNKV